MIHVHFLKSSRLSLSTASLANMSLKSPAPVLAELKKLLSGLEEVLKPLLTRNFSSLTAELESRTKTVHDRTVHSGKLESAQLQASLAYVILDLVWIMLKVDAKDPNGHPVAAELKRVQGYLEKVHKLDSENPGKGEAHPAPAVDREKAARFIQGALGKRTIFAEDGSVQRVVDAGEEEQDGKETKITKSNKKAEQDSKKIRKAQKEASGTVQHSQDAHKAEKRMSKHKKSKK